MKTFKTILITAACIVSIAWLFELDYNDLSWMNNSVSYWGLISNCFVILILTVSIKLKNRKAQIR